MKVVISIGGSLLSKEPDLIPKAEDIKKFAEVLKRLKDKGHQIVVTCGAGKICRRYQALTKEFGAGTVLQDNIGTETTHLNSYLLIAALGSYAHQESLRKPAQVKKLFGDKILVGGGDKPGHSTDFDAALHAKAINADLLVNVTNVNGVYSDDPKKNPAAKKHEALTHKQFLKIIKKNAQMPGEYKLFDMKATKLIKRLKLKTIFVDGNDPEEIVRAVEGNHHGTAIQS